MTLSPRKEPKPRWLIALSLVDKIRLAHPRLEDSLTTARPLHMLPLSKDARMHPTLRAHMALHSKISPISARPLALLVILKATAPLPTNNIDLLRTKSRITIRPPSRCPI